MKKLFSALAEVRWLAPVTLGLALLAAGEARAQTPFLYTLGTLTGTADYSPFGGPIYTTGQQVLSAIRPGNPALGTFPTVITGVAVGQQLVAIDVRPATGQLYALGYDPTTGANNAQLYLLSITGTLAQTGASTATITAVPVGSAIRLELGTSQRTDLQGYTLLLGIGFDFNPRADRLRVTGGLTAQANYVLNPNTGAVQARQSDLTYASSGNAVTPNSPPRVSTVAYTNSAPDLTGTTLYDFDETPSGPGNNRAILATQSLTVNAAVPANATNGTLTAQANVQLVTKSGTFTIGDANFDLDVYTDRNTGQNIGYLLELPGPTASSPGSANVYSLELTGASAGTATYLGPQANGGNIIGGAGNRIRYTNIAAAPTVATYVWTGATSTDWATASNWSTNAVPTSTTDVFIPGPGPSVPRQPTVSGTQAARTLTLSAGATGPSVLTSANGSELDISGNFVNNGGSVAGVGTGFLALVGATQHDIGGSTATTFWNLQVGMNSGNGGASATTSAAVSIQRSVAVFSNLAIGPGLDFILLSSASGTAFVANNGGFVTGLATVQRYITPTNPGAGYRHYSSPVARVAANATSNTVADLATGTFTPAVNPAYNAAATPRQVRPYPTVFAYDQARLASSNNSYAVGDFDNGFFSPAALTDTLAPGRGYTVNLGGTELVDFQGKLHSGNYPVGPAPRGAQASAGYYLLGNPYPGAISYTVLSTALNNFQDGLYVYKSNGQYTGAYSSYLTNGQSVNGGSDNIPVAQGFFLRVAAGQTGSGNFTNQCRNNAPETAIFQRPTTPTAPTLALTLSGSGAANQTRVYFDPAATPAFDNGRDAHYLPASHGLDLASDLSSEALAINGLPLLTGATITVPLRLHAALAGTYILTVDELLNLPAGYGAYLRDGRTNTYTNLATTPSVPVTLAPADAASGRFAVVFATSQPLATAPAALTALVALYPNPAHGTATLVLPQALRGQVASQIEVLNMLGQVVLRRAVAATSSEAVELPLTGLAAGVYTVRATTATGTVARQLRVE